jgi:hypothetical protein
MDIQQLQMILDAASAAGEGAFWIALMWLGVGYFKTLSWLIALGILCWFGGRAVAKINECCAATTAATNALRVIGNEMKQKTGKKWHFSVPSDLEAVVEAIRKLK